MIAWRFRDDYRYEESDLWVRIDLLLHFHPQLSAILGKGTFDDDGNFGDFEACHR